MMKNKGYTLVEVVIVVAIMAILGGVSFMTIGIIRESKCQSGTNTLNNQISSCLVRTKAVSKATNGSDNPLCMVIKKRSDNAYAVMAGYIYGNTVKDSSGNDLDPDTDANCEAILPKEIVNIKYICSTSDTSQQFPNDEMVIQFVKSEGSTCYGGGKYEIYAGKADNQKLYATIYLDPVSGKHYIE